MVSYLKEFKNKCVPLFKIIVKPRDKDTAVRESRGRFVAKEIQNGKAQLHLQF